jgi:hypothetical protein
MLQSSKTSNAFLPMHAVFSDITLMTSRPSLPSQYWCEWSPIKDQNFSPASLTLRNLRFSIPLIKPTILWVQILPSANNSNSNPNNNWAYIQVKFFTSCQTASLLVFIDILSCFTKIGSQRLNVPLASYPSAFPADLALPSPYWPKMMLPFEKILDYPKVTPNIFPFQQNQ